MSGGRIIVVGAGVGGLVAAVLLAARGEEVLVLEAHNAPGGKMRQVMVRGSAIDAGPTVLTMRWVFDSIFAAAGESLDTLVSLAPLDILARHAWDDRGHLDLHADVARSADAIGQFCGAAEAQRFTCFAAEARAIHDLLKESFLMAQKPGPLGLALHRGLAGLPAMTRINPFETMWRALSRHFADPRLIQLFGRYATYCGSSPFSAPATLMLVAHVEQEGVWTLEGGMHRLAVALEGLAVRKGATFRYGTPVARIETGSGRVTGVVTASGERLACSEVIFNGDAHALASGLLGPEVAHATRPVRPRQRSLSALTWCSVAATAGFPLHRHNVFFSQDYRAEFADLERGPPTEPTVYVCAQDRPGSAPAADRLLILVNAPAGCSITGSRLEAVTAAMQRRLEACGLDIDRSLKESIITGPEEFARLFPATGGALYGRATHGWLASFQRPAAAARIPGLFLAGGSVHPGPGVPMAALSGRLAVDALLARRASIRRFHRAAIAGGMRTA